VRKRWPQERIEGTQQALWSLERTDDLAVLLGKLSVQANL
jgi:hypothetical protein